MSLSAISVYDNGFLPNNAFGRIHGLNFVGAGVTVEVPAINFIGDVGIATIKIAVNDVLNRGDIGQILFNTTAGVVGGASNFYYNAITTNVGIGSTIPTEKLDVDGNVNISGTLSANAFIGDGSGLTGIVEPNFGIEIQENGTPVGTAGTINIGDNLSVDFNNGIATLEGVVIGISTDSQKLGGELPDYYLDYDNFTNTPTTLNVIVSNVVPESSVEGNLWYDSSIGRGFIYYDDGDSLQWVDFSPALSGISGGVNIESPWIKTSAGIHTLSNVGIGTTDPTSALTVSGDISVSGVVTATNFVGNLTGTASFATNANISAYADIAGISTFSGYADIAGISTVTEGLTGTPDIEVGIVTAIEYYGTFKGEIDDNVSLGTATYAVNAGIATYADTAGISTFSGYADTAGISTFSGSADTAEIAAYATVAGIATYTSEWILGAVGSSDYTFTGPGFTGAESDPILYLVRGQQYKFTNTMGAHPFRIQSTPNGSTGTQYNDGITNNDVSNGTLTWNVQFNAPGLLYYQCTAHGGMGGKIYIVDAGVGPDISVNTTGIITATTFSGSLIGNADTATFSVFSNVANYSLRLPQNLQNEAYTLTDLDAGKHVAISTGGITLNSSTFNTGDTVTIFNNSDETQMITLGPNVTMRRVSIGDTGNRGLNSYGLVTILCISSALSGGEDSYVISGAGLT
jgi:plastocyanin